MLSISPAVKIFLRREPTDLRRGFDGLAALVEDALGQDPLSGHLFLFLNRRRNRIKLLYWSGDGYAVWYKRLEKGTFQLPQLAEGPHESLHAPGKPNSPLRCEISASDLSLILDGIDLASVRRRPRFELRRTG